MGGESKLWHLRWDLKIIIGVLLGHVEEDGVGDDDIQVPLLILYVVELHVLQLALTDDHVLRVVLVVLSFETVADLLEIDIQVLDASVVRFGQIDSS